MLSYLKGVSVFYNDFHEKWKFIKKFYDLFCNFVYLHCMRAVDNIIDFGYVEVKLQEKQVGEGHLFSCISNKAWMIVLLPKKINHYASEFILFQYNIVA